MESIQEQIIKQIEARLRNITATDGYANTIRSVQRLNQSGIVETDVPLLLILEGESTPEVSPSPWTQRRLEVYVVAAMRQDETEVSPDLRSGGEIVNSLMTDVERALFTDPTFNGLAIRIEPPSYLEIDVEMGVPHLTKALRTEIIFQHLRQNPYAA